MIKSVWTGAKIILPVSMGLMLACASASIDSTVRPKYDKKIDKVFVVLMTNARGSVKFVDGLKPALSQELSKHRIDNHIFLYHSMDLDVDSSMKKDLEAYQPQYILFLEQTAKVLSSGSEGGAADFELVLREFGNETPVWKASLHTVGSISWSGKAGSPELTAQKVVNKLIQDGLIRN